MDNEKLNSAYECMFIVDVTNGNDAAVATVDKFLSLVKSNGEIIDIADWGKRRFEYPINDKAEGYYTVVTFRAPAAFPAEFERLLSIDENVMRTLILKLDEEVAEKVARRVSDRAAAAEAAAVAAAEAAAAEAAAAEAAATEAVADEAPVAETEKAAATGEAPVTEATADNE